MHLYGIDAGGGGLAALSALPHCGAVVSRHDMERLGRLLRRLNQELTNRQDLAQQHNATGIAELRKLLPAAERPAHILLLVDGWDSLSVILDEHDHGQLVQEVIRLVREGAGAGDPCRRHLRTLPAGRADGRPQRPQAAAAAG